MSDVRVLFNFDLSTVYAKRASNNRPLIKSVQFLEMLCVVATLLTNHKFFPKYFISQITITRPDGSRSLLHCVHKCTQTKTLCTYNYISYDYFSARK